MPPHDRTELLTAIEAGREFSYLPFYGHRAEPGTPAGPWLFSQWWPAGFTVDGQMYRSTEQYMMERKADLFGDTATAARILDADSPAEAKQLGREARGFDSATWRRHRFDIVVRGNEAKFGQDDALAEHLRSTGDTVLVEASPDDRVWGVGRALDDPAATDPRQWDGENLLGFALMRVRDALRTQS
ncbi:NADAR family protein [Pseudonocardia sp. KRD291]|uniref:NADAR family protein n=1 Tax=Pseudonocardia sp. KRD291 TaxID=2792007 RepID=UPI001C4A386E|nr:NADAR family protein [Pseudonocardia sp. KRD291]MBW0102346.1 NADAR family protein [Pseudonocardia sp. KRD291]